MARSIDELMRMATIAVALLAAVAARAAPPHQHGVGQLEAAIEGEALTLGFSLPLDSLLGFERAPRTAAEKQAADQVVERLRREAEMVRPDPAARCERTDVTLVSSALGLGGAPAAAAGEEHADIDVTYSYRCREPARLAQIELPLMTAFARLGRVEAQIVGPKGQSRQSLKRASPKLVVPR